MRKALILIALASPLLLLLLYVPTVDIPAVFAQTPDGEHNCPSPTAIPPYIGTGTSIFSPNQNLCLPELAPVVPGGPVSFIVQGVEPGIRVDSQGTIYEVSIRGVPGGIDLWRWYQSVDGPPTTTNGPLPFKYEGRPDLCGIFLSGCNAPPPVIGPPGVAPGGGDADIAVNSPIGSGAPNLAVTSLSLANVTASHSTDRGDTFTPPNVLAALISGDDRQWNDAIDTLTVYLEYHDLGTFNIDVQGRMMAASPTSTARARPSILRLSPLRAEQQVAPTSPARSKLTTAVAPAEGTSTRSLSPPTTPPKT
jgi:hypothetical protein